MTKWRYGDAWEHYPIEPGEIWGVFPAGSRLAVHNIFDPLPPFMLSADMLFTDPPWTLGNINSFYTKAGRSDHLESFGAFEDILFERIAQIGPAICYLEVGRQAVDGWQERLTALYPSVQRWDVVYYRKHPCCILRGGMAPQPFDFSGMDEERVIGKAALIESYSVLGDLCMGRGLVGLAAYGAGKPFVGTELNKRRLAVLLSRLAQRGADVGKYLDREGYDEQE